MKRRLEDGRHAVKAALAAAAVAIASVSGPAIGVAQDAGPAGSLEIASPEAARFDLPTSRQMVAGHYALAALFQENGNYDGASIEYENIANLLAPHFESFTESDATVMAQALLALSELYRPRALDAAEQVAAQNLGLILQWAETGEQGVWLRLHAAQTARASVILLLNEEFDQAGEVAAEALRSISAIEEAGVRVPERMKAQAMSAFGIGVVNASSPELASDAYERMTPLLEPVEADLDRFLSESAGVFAVARIVGADAQDAVDAIEQGCFDYTSQTQLAEAIADYRLRAEADRICAR